MTIWIMQNSTEKGGQSVSWLQGGKDEEVPTDRNHLIEPQWGCLWTPLRDNRIPKLSYELFIIICNRFLLFLDFIITHCD